MDMGQMREPWIPSRGAWGLLQRWGQTYRGEAAPTRLKKEAGGPSGGGAPFPRPAAGAWTPSGTLACGRAGWRAEVRLSLSSLSYIVRLAWGGRLSPRT